MCCGVNICGARLYYAVKPTPNTIMVQEQKSSLLKIENYRLKNSPLFAPIKCANIALLKRTQLIININPRPRECYFITAIMPSVEYNECKAQS